MTNNDVKVLFVSSLPIACILLLQLKAAAAEQRLIHEITLPAAVQVQQTEVTFADIATIPLELASFQNEGRQIFLDAVQAIDICHLQPGEEKNLSREYLQLRLAIAGWPSDDVQLKGARQVNIRRSGTPTDYKELIEQRIERQIAQRTDRPQEDFQVRLITPLSTVLPSSSKHLDGYFFQIQVPNDALIGRLPITVRWINNDGIGVEKTAIATVAVKRLETRLKRTIPRGQTIQESDLAEERLFSMSAEVGLSSSVIIGRQARRTLQVGEFIRENDLAPVSLVKRTEPVIQSRSAIRLVVRHNGLEAVVPMAEALQSGEIGQIIRVRNLESKRIVNARIVSHDEAVVEIR